MRRSHRPGLGLRPLLAVIAVVLSLARAAAAADTPAVPPGPMGEREITIVNKSKQPINEVYVSPAGSDQGGDDRLRTDTIPVGESFRVRLGRMRECGFDVHVVYEDASTEASLNTNVCRSRLLAFDGSNAVAPPPREAHTVVIINASARPIQNVFVSPAEANDWGEDLVPDDTISVGGRASVTYRGDCAADVRVVFDNHGAEERQGLNLCDTPRISIQPGWTTADTVPTGEAAPAPPAVTPPAATPPPPPAVIRPTATIEVTVVNHSGRDAAELYVFPQDGREHGPDRLGMTVLKQNSQLVVRIPKGAQCLFNAHVVYSGKNADADLTGLDLCATPTITLPP